MSKQKDNLLTTFALISKHSAQHYTLSPPFLLPSLSYTSSLLWAPGLTARSRVAIFREKMLPRNTEQTEILIHFVGIPYVSRNGKRSEFRSEPFCGREKPQSSRVSGRSSELAPPPPPPQASVSLQDPSEEGDTHLQETGAGRAYY